MLVLEAGLLVAFGVLAFGVPMRGALGALLLICLLGSLAFGGLGLLVAARPRTLEGASGLMNLAMVPMWVFSGVFFSSSRFPEVIQPFVQALPLTAVNDALRANMLEGASLAQLGPELAIVIAWMVGSFVLALRIFRWQ
jgi:ABC-type polysaccharide/polyol phosphate export permease